MAKLSISSGAISLNNLRNLYDISSSISLGDFRTGGSLHELKRNNVAMSLSNAYVSTSDTYWRTRTQQNATGANGSGTVSTSFTQRVRYKNPSETLVISGSGTSETFSNLTDIHNFNGPFGSPEFIDPFCTVSRGTLRSAGSYSSWSNSTDSKGNVTGSSRSKNDYYGLTVTNSKKYDGTTNLNPITSGSASMSQLYGHDTGEWEFGFNGASGGGGRTGYAHSGYFLSSSGFGSLSGATDSDAVLSADSNINNIEILGIFTTSTAYHVFIGYTNASSSAANLAQELAKIRYIQVNGTTNDFDDLSSATFRNNSFGSGTFAIEYFWLNSAYSNPTISTSSVNNVKLIFA